MQPVLRLVLGPGARAPGPFRARCAPRLLCATPAAASTPSPTIAIASAGRRPVARSRHRAGGGPGCRRGGGAGAYDAVPLEEQTRGVKNGSSGISVGRTRQTLVRTPGRYTVRTRSAVRPAAWRLAHSHCGWRHLRPRLVKGRAVTRGRPRLRRPLTSLPGRATSCARLTPARRALPNRPVYLRLRLEAMPDSPTSMPGGP